MDLIFDTNVLIHAEREGRQVGELIDTGDQPAVAAITIAELMLGVELAEHDIQRTRARKFLADVNANCDVIGYGSRVVGKHARLMAWTIRQGVKHGPHDLIIAASAIADDRTLVTAELAPTFDLPGLHVQRLNT